MTIPVKSGLELPSTSTAVTAAPGDNTTKVATTAFVGTAITALGAVAGPASSVDNTFALFDGVTGKLIKQASNITRGATGNLVVDDGNVPAAGITSLARYVAYQQETLTGTMAGVMAGSLASHRATIRLVRARGTLAAPTAVVSGDMICEFRGSSWDGADTQENVGVLFIVDGAVSSGVVPSRIGFFVSTTNTAGRSEKASLFSDGNFSIGSTTNSGEKLQVTGTSKFTGQITSTLAIGTAPFVVASTTLVTNLNADLLDGKDTGTSGNTVPLLDGVNTWSGNQAFSARISAGTTIRTAAQFNVGGNQTGGASLYGVYNDGIIQSDVTSGYIYNFTNAQTAAAAFTCVALYHFRAAQGVFGAGSTVTNQYGFFASSTLIGATNNFGFRGDIAAAAGRWNVFMDGTALNYLNGGLLIGSTTDTGEKLQITGTSKIGTVTSGTWNGTAIAAIYGGTGLASYTTGNYINAASASTLQERTPAQVLTDINGVAATAVNVPATDTETSYPNNSVSTGSMTAGGPMGGGIGTHLTVESNTGNRVAQLAFSLQGGTGVPDMWLRTSHSSVGGGGFTPFYKLLHYGTFEPYTVTTVTAGYTETAAYGDKIIRCNLAAGFTVVLPSATTSKARLTFKKIDPTGVIILDGASAQTIDGALTISLTAQYESVTLVSDGANWMII